MGNYSEIIDNMGSDSDSTWGSVKGLEIDATYNNPAKMEDDEKKQIPEKEVIITADVGKELYEDSVPITDNLSVDQAQIKIERNERAENPETKIINAKVEKKNSKSNAEYPVLAKGKTKNNGKSNKKSNYVKGRTCKVRSGYKYQGKGFEVFTGYKNKSQPIYSSTMLYCREICNENEQELRTYLIENGKFKKEMIEEVIFKTNSSNYYNHYALIKVRAPLKIIKKKIKTLNKYARYETMKIFKRSGYISANDMANANNVLYVNNFDILNRNRDPYAIIHFRDLQDAKKCFAAKDLSFGGK